MTNAVRRKFSGDESFKDMATAPSMLDSGTRLEAALEKRDKDAGRRGEGSRGKL